MQFMLSRVRWPGGRSEIHRPRSFMGSLCALCAKRRAEGEEPEAAVEPTPVRSPLEGFPIPSWRPRPGTDELPDEFLQDIVDNDADEGRRNHAAGQLTINERKRERQR